MENNVNNEIEYIINAIQEYMNGNEEYEEIIDVVIQALNQFKKLNFLKMR